jgi:cell division protein FtsL
MIRSTQVALTPAVKKPARRKRQTGPTSPALSFRVWPLGFVLVLVVAVASSGIVLVRGAHELRALHSALDESQTRQDRLMAEYSRLLLERSTFAGLQTVEAVASQELQMGYPDNIEEIAP